MQQHKMTPTIQQLQQKLITFYDQKKKHPKDKLIRDAYNVVLDKLDKEWEKEPFPWATSPPHPPAQD